MAGGRDLPLRGDQHDLVATTTPNARARSEPSTDSEIPPRKSLQRACFHLVRNSVIAVSCCGSMRAPITPCTLCPNDSMPCPGDIRRGGGDLRMLRDFIQYGCQPFIRAVRNHLQMRRRASMRAISFLEAARSSPTAPRSTPSRPKHASMEISEMKEMKCIAPLGHGYNADR